MTRPLFANAAGNGAVSTQPKATTAHFGDPCIQCGVGHDDVASGPCPATTGELTKLVIDLHDAKAAMQAYDLESKAEFFRLNSNFVALQTKLNQLGSGLNADKVALGQSVIFVRGVYAKAGQDRASVIADAVQWLATGKSNAYRGLDVESYGTKNYDGWAGQRSDHSRGMGPRHGSIVFQVGLTKQDRVLSVKETEAAIYYLLNLEKVQAAALAAAVQA